MVKMQIEKDNDDMIFVLWEGNDNQIVHYSRDKLVEGETIETDGEYEKKEKCLVGGYIAYFYQKKEESWLDWSDQNYHYHIFMKNINSSREELLKMSKSIYE